MKHLNRPKGKSSCIALLTTMTWMNVRIFIFMKHTFIISVVSYFQSPLKQLTGRALLKGITVTDSNPQFSGYDHASQVAMLPSPCELPVKQTSSLTKLLCYLCCLQSDVDGLCQHLELAASVPFARLVCP